MAYEDVEDLNGFLESLKDLAPTVRKESLRAFLRDTEFTKDLAREFSGARRGHTLYFEDDWLQL